MDVSVRWNNFDGYDIILFFDVVIDDTNTPVVD